MRGRRQSARVVQKFIAEVRRRKVLRVVAIYAVFAWLILQIAEVTFTPLGLPDWAMRTLILAAISGFPLAFILAWVIDIRPDGMIFDLPLWPRDTVAPDTEKKTDVVFVFMLAIMMAVGTYQVAGWLFGDVAEEDVTTARAPAPANSIAVLAFENFGGGADTGFFGSGLAEEILNLLAALEELKVAARTSSFQFRGEKQDIRDIAERLGVRHVLEGSVRQEGEQIRVTAQLIDGESGYHRWSRAYDRGLDDIFDIQLEIAEAVVNELKIALSVDSEERLQARPTENIDAYVFYVQGQGRLRGSLDADAMRTASVLFDKALEIDPNFARAHAGLCEAYLRLYHISNDGNDFQTAESACEEAGRLDPGMTSEIHLALGQLYRYRGLYDRAEAKLRNAIAISPAAVDAHIELGEIRMAQDRRQEAEVEFLRAVDLKRNYWKAHEALAYFYYRTERYQESAERYELVTSLAPDVASVFSGKGAAYSMLGESDKARAAWDRSLELKPSRLGYTNMGLRYYYAGQFQDAVEMQRKALEYAPDDHRVWGRLAESYRFLPDNETNAVEAYRNAAKFAEETLAVNTSDWVTTGLLGLYYAHLGRADEAIDLVDRSVSMSQRNSEALYYQALARLQTGDQTGALDALEEAVAFDEQYRQFIETDPDLTLLKETERFEQFLRGDGER